MVGWFGLDYRIQRRGAKRHLMSSVSSRKLRSEPQASCVMLAGLALSLSMCLPTMFSGPLIRIDPWNNEAGVTGM